MVLTKCDGCQERRQDKPIQVTFAWRRTDGVRKAHRSMLCAACFTMRVAPLDRDYSGVERLTCPNCGIDTEDDHDDVYTTEFIPHYGKHTTEAPFCGACAATYRIWVQEHSRELESSFGATGGPEHDIAADDILRSLGIQPRPGRDLP